MPLPRELEEYFEKNGSTITSAQANALGISNERLRLLIKADELERVAHGVYISPDDFLDKMYVLQIRRPNMFGIKN